MKITTADVLAKKYKDELDVLLQYVDAFFLKLL